MTYRPFNTIQSSGVQDSRPNNTGGTITKATPVTINAVGELDGVDVSVESSALSIVGVAAANIPDGSSGNFVSSGKLTDITTTANLGDILFVDQSGGLTNVKPSIGVGGFSSGDFVISVGVVAKNIDNGSLKDLVLNIQVVGQL